MSGERKPLPRVLDDEWEPPQSNRGHRAVVAAFIGLALIVSCVGLVRSFERVSTSDAEHAWAPPPRAPAPPVMTQDTGLRARRLTGTLNHFDGSEEDEMLESPPPPRPPRPRPRPAGYLSINSSPWAELSVDGHAVGSTPQIRIRVTPGRHHLILMRSGFQPRSAWVTVPAGSTVRLTDITLAAVIR